MQLGMALDTAKIGCWSWNPSTGQLDWDSRTYAMHGKQAADFQPSLEKLDEVIDKNDIAHFKTLRGFNSLVQSVD